MQFYIFVTITLTYIPTDLPEIYIEIDTYICEDIGEYSGKTCAIDENTLIIVLSSKNIK